MIPCEEEGCQRVTSSVPCVPDATKRSVCSHIGIHSLLFLWCSVSGATAAAQRETLEGNKCPSKSLREPQGVFNTWSLLSLTSVLSLLGCTPQFKSRAKEVHIEPLRPGYSSTCVLTELLPFPSTLLPPPFLLPFRELSKSSNGIIFSMWYICLSALPYSSTYP